MTCFQQPIVRRRHRAAGVARVVRVIRSNGGADSENTHHESKRGQQQHRGLHAGARAHSAILLLRHGKLREGRYLELAHTALLLRRQQRAVDGQELHQLQRPGHVT